MRYGQTKSINFKSKRRRKKKMAIFNKISLLQTHKAPSKDLTPTPTLPETPCNHPPSPLQLATLSSNPPLT
jgi:hypothetical protein